MNYESQQSVYLVWFNILCSNKIYTSWFSVIISVNIDRFSYFFHQQVLEETRWAAMIEIDFQLTLTMLLHYTVKFENSNYENSSHDQKSKGIYLFEHGVNASCTCHIKVVLMIKRLGWHRKASSIITITSCGQHLNYCVWQLDLSTELRKLTSTASLSSCRRSCSEQSRTFWTLTLHSVWNTTFLFFIAHYICMVMISQFTLCIFTFHWVQKSSLQATPLPVCSSCTVGCQFTDVLSSNFIALCKWTNLRGEGSMVHNMSNIAIFHCRLLLNQKVRCA